MNIANQFKKTGVFLAKKGLITVLEKLAMTTMPVVKGDGITGEKMPHDSGDGYGAG